MMPHVCVVRMMLSQHHYYLHPHIHTTSCAYPRTSRRFTSYHDALALSCLPFVVKAAQHPETQGKQKRKDAQTAV